MPFETAPAARGAPARGRDASSEIAAAHRGAVAMALAISLGAGAVARADDAAPFTTTVTAAPAATTPRADSAAAASVVLPAESPRAHDDLASLLLEVPGVSITRTGSTVAFTSVALRGSNPDEVIVYVDGIPLNVAEGGAVDLSTLPLGDVERVEVYRGTTPLAFGESAMGGVISITTRTPAATRALFHAGVGSFGTFFADAAGGGHVGRFRVYAGAHLYRSKGDYPYVSDNLTPLNSTDDYATTLANNDALAGNGVLRLAMTLGGRRTLSAGVIGFGRAQGLPGPRNYPTTAARFHTVRGLAYLRYDGRDDLGPGGRLSAQAFAGVQRDRLLDPLGEVLQRGPMTTHETTVSTGVTAHATRPLDDWGRLSAVLEGRREAYSEVNEAEPALSGVPARRLVGVAGGELDLRLRPLKLHLIPSVRVELGDDIVTGQNSAGQFLSASPPERRALPIYRLGAVRPLGETATLKANFGRYARVPSFLELYGNGNDRLLGNPTLVPERGDNADLALWIDRPGPTTVLSRTTLFGARADDLIYWVRSTAGLSRAANLSRARIYGLEQELRLAFGTHGRLVAQGTYTVALDDSGASVSDGKQLPHHPRVTGYLRPELLRVPLPAGLELAMYADAALFTGAFADPANLERVPTQLLLGAGFSLLAPRAHLRATVSGLNLTDLSTWDLLYGTLPGRTVFLALTYEPAGGDDAGLDSGGASTLGYP